MLNWDDPLSTQKPVVTETQKTAPAVDNKPEAAVGSAAETAKPAGKPKASATDTLDPSANI
ncbi:hypothetical protein BOW15_11035, partial [Solemya velum gill symbiont]